MAAELDKSQEKSLAHETLPIEGRFARYNSPFLQLMIPVLTTRYVWQALEEINPFNVLKKPDPRLTEGFKPWEPPKTARYISRNISALGMGTIMLGVIGYYSKKTYNDIRTMYAEAVGFELGKRPEDIDAHDLMKSQNAALAVTREAFLKRTLVRMAAGAAFFVPWHAVRGWKSVGSMPKFAANANAGVGAIGAYLSMDGFLRKQSFFEAEQILVDTSINHVDNNTRKHIMPEEIEALMQLQRKHVNPKYKWPPLNSCEAKEQAKLGERIAELMNQTYNNTENTEGADFTLGKFNMLVGFGLLDDYPQSLGFVEVANKSNDMHEIKSAIAAIRSGQSKQAALESIAPSAQSAPAVPVPEAPTRKFTDHVHRKTLPEAARSALELASETSSKNMAAL